MPFWCWFLGEGFYVHSRTMWAPPDGLSWEIGSFFRHCNSHKILWPEVMRLYFPTLKSWVAQSVLLPSCSSWVIHKQMWDHLVCHLATCPLHPSFLSLPLLLVWMNVSSLTPWLLDFHTVRFSGSSGCFLFLNLFLSFFWLCEEAKHIYLCLHLGWKCLSLFYINFLK